MKNVVEGARDMLPAEAMLERWLNNKIQGVLVQFGFCPWDSPLLEYRSLYNEDSNEDLVNLQAFVFQDINGNEVVLRPELTPSLARVIALHKHKLILPLRLYSYGPFWRNENLVPGRGREFRQWNIDIVGVPPPIADCELIVQAISQLVNFGLTSADVVVKVNSRMLLRAQLHRIGIPQGLFAHLIRLLDKSIKDESLDFPANLKLAGLTNQQIAQLKKYLNDKDLWKEDEVLSSIFETVKTLGWQDFVEYEPKIVRFPPYYTGLILEAYDRAGRFPAILGGGRYDHLIEKIGGEANPAAGFAIGNITIVEVLREKNLLPQIDQAKPDILVSASKEHDLPYAIQLAQLVRSRAIQPEIAPFFGSLSEHMVYGEGHRVQKIANVSGSDQAKLEIQIVHIKSGYQQTYSSIQEAASSIHL